MNIEMRNERTQFYREIQHLNQEMKDFKDNQLDRKIKDCVKQNWEKIQNIFIAILCICVIFCCMMLVELLRRTTTKNNIHY